MFGVRPRRMYRSGGARVERSYSYPLRNLKPRRSRYRKGRGKLRMAKTKKSSTQSAPVKEPIQNLDRAPARDSQVVDFLTLQEIAMAAPRILSQSSREP